MARPPTDTIRFLTLDELGRLLAAARASTRDRALFLVAYRHGLRASEVGLRRAEDLDLRTLRLTVHWLKGSHSGTHPVQPDEAKALRPWLRDHAVAEARDHGDLADRLEERCRAVRIEPPTPDRVARIVRGEVRLHEDRLHATIHARLPPEVRERLDALLHPPPSGAAGDEDDEDQPSAAGARALLNFVRGDPGKTGVAGVARGLERLEAIRAVGLPPGLFAGVLPHEVELCRRRVAVQPPSDLRHLPEPARLVWLAAYVHLRGRALTDGLVPCTPSALAPSVESSGKCCTI